jgi:ABC-type Fe3+-siderophore transport system permease subunit
MNFNVTANVSSDKNTSTTNTVEDKQIEESEQYLMSLMGELEDDLWWDMLIPSFVALVATICVWITRRLRII